MKSNNDREGEENSKKAEENNNSGRESHFLVHFFEITPHDCDGREFYSDVYKGRNFT